jgi:hypothetical protein
MALAAELKGSVGNVRGHVDQVFSVKDQAITKVHSDVESLAAQLAGLDTSRQEERGRLESLLATKEEEQRNKLGEYL